MDKAHPLISPMVVRSLKMKDNPFRPREGVEDVLGPGVLYLSEIGVLTYLAINTRPAIAFSINLLVRRYSFDPTRRHWIGVKHLLHCIRGIGIFYPKNGVPTLVGYIDAGYLSDTVKEKSQTGSFFSYGNTTVSWMSIKQTLTTTSPNKAELVSL